MKNLFFALFLAVPLYSFASNPDSLALSEGLPPSDSLAVELVVPDDFAVTPVFFKDGKGVGIDTLDVGNSNLQIVLCDDHSWYYIKNMEKVAQDSVFTQYWAPNRLTAYDVPLDKLDYRMILPLVDSMSHFVAPHIGEIYSKFGYRRGRPHQGVDLPLPTGTPLYNAFDGCVRLSKYVSGYGNLVIVRHENGLETYYGHLSKREVEAGDWIKAGDVVGLGGSTGKSTGPHLHFETRYMGHAFDPQWIVDFEKGELRKNVFVLRRSYLSASSRYVPQSIEEEELGYEEDMRIIEEEKRIAAERAAMRYHTVKSGETLSGIAAKNGKSLKQIKDLNQGINPNKIRIGQKIRVN